MKTQLEEIKPGETALVMCVDSETYSQTSFGYRLFESLPILPYPPHTDKEIIGFPDLHYHYDFRFWSNELAESVAKELELYYDQNPEEWMATVQRLDKVVGEPYLKELVCIREMPIFPNNYSFIPKLEEAYKNQPLVNSICPHRGYHTFKSTRDGCDRVCPGHGLGFKNGKVCERGIHSGL